jgi:riboflavin synthase
VIRPPKPLARFIAAKGSVCLDGVSLTVNRLDLAGADDIDDFELMIVPHTLEVTTFGKLAAGDRLNLEIDVLARYVLRGAEVDGRDDAGARDARLMDKLVRSGLL